MKTIGTIIDIVNALYDAKASVNIYVTESGTANDETVIDVVQKNTDLFRDVVPTEADTSLYINEKGEPESLIEFVIKKEIYDALTKDEEIKEVVKETSDTSYIIYTDGGCDSNPGGRGGYGIVILDTAAGESKELSGGYESTTNNRMEVMAVIKALENVPEGADVTLYSDSQYVIRTLEGEYSIKKNQDLWDQLLPLKQSRNVTLHWVRGHNGNRNNERCDELATLAMAKKDLLVDEGYGPKKEEQSVKASTTQAGGAMAVDIDVPDYITRNVTILKTERSAHKECSELIRQINEKDKPSFKDFANLKTGGIDDWSNVSYPELETLCGSTVLKIIGKYFDTAYESASVMKWYCRGLNLEFAIRKVLVDCEIRKKLNK